MSKCIKISSLLNACDAGNPSCVVDIDMAKSNGAGDSQLLQRAYTPASASSSTVSSPVSFSSRCSPSTLPDSSDPPAYLLAPETFESSTTFSNAKKVTHGGFMSPLQSPALHYLSSRGLFSSFSLLDNTTSTTASTLLALSVGTNRDLKRPASELSTEARLLPPVFLATPPQSSSESSPKAVQVKPSSLPQHVVLESSKVEPTSKSNLNSQIISTKRVKLDAGVVLSPTSIFMPNFRDAKRQKGGVRLPQLKLAKKRHYIPNENAKQIQKRTGSKRPQGRPFTKALSAKFIFHESPEQLMCNLLNTSAVELSYLLNPEIKEAEDDAGAYKLHIEGAEIVEYQTDGRKEPFMCVNFDSTNKGTKVNGKETEKDNVHEHLCELFNTEDITFVKVMRDTNSKVKKIETFRPYESDTNIHQDDLDNIQSESDLETFLGTSSLDGASMQCTPQWIKRNIAHPRYKAGMKLHFLAGVHSFVIYNDPQMYIWDLKVGNVAKNVHKKIILNSVHGLDKYF